MTSVNMGGVESDLYQDSNGNFILVIKHGAEEEYITLPAEDMLEAMCLADSQLRAYRYLHSS